MQIAQVLGGYSLGGADLLRRAMGKKKPEEMAQQRDDLRRRRARRTACAQPRPTQHLRPDGEVRRLRLQQVARRRVRAARVPDRLPEGAPPGGVHGGRLSADMDDTDKVRQFYEDAVGERPDVLPPDVNASEYRFVPVGPRQPSATASARSGHRARRRSRRSSRRARAGPFRDLFDFCRRVDKRMVNRRVVEALVRAGAFDSLDANRAQPARLGRPRARGGGAGRARRRRRTACSAKPRRRAAAPRSYVDARAAGT